MAEEISDGFIHAGGGGVLIDGDTNSTVDLDFIVEALTKIELDLAYFSEKLTNLDLYITNLSLRENNLGASSYSSLENNDSFSAEDHIEEALVIDLSCSYTGSEAEVLGCSLESVHQEILNAGLMISSLKDAGGEFSAVMQAKLQGSETSLNNLQDQVLEIKKQLSLLEGSKTSAAAAYTLVGGEKFDGLKLDVQITKQQKIVLRMLEKSLARELDLEKKLLELKHNEQQQNLKLFHADQVASAVEEASEVAWGRLLEAENATEVYKGIAKEMMSKLQISQFSHKSSLQREEELKSKLKEMDARLKKANDKSEACEDKLSQMCNMIDDLRKDCYMAESRADVLEGKLAKVGVTNTELTEELGFLKSNVDSKEEKISSLQKQVRDLETQLNHAKVASEASQEQQNMLYSAIWDMETLIEDLKSKVSKAETRAEDAEDQCLVLAETNMKLNKEITRLKSRTESLEETVNEAQRAKLERVKDIDRGAKLIADMAMQLAIERERIHKQLSSLARENMILMEELRRTRKTGTSDAKQLHGKEDGKNESALSIDSFANTNSTEASTEEITEPTSTSNEVVERVNDSGGNETKISSVQAVKDATVSPEYEAVAAKEPDGYGYRCLGWNWKYIFFAIIVLTSSALAVHMTFSALGVHLGQGNNEN
ncbi:hypothetical protein Dimus_031208 [Dionaea muscipula]